MNTADSDTSYNAYMLAFKCPDRLGVVAGYSQLLLECGAFITEVSNYSDQLTETFFLRCVFDDRAMTLEFDTFCAKFEELAQQLQMEYVLRPVGMLPKVLLAVSKYDHCLSTLLTKWKSGALPAEIVGVVSNHEDCRGLVEWYGLPYKHLPITPETKPQQEAQILALMDEFDVDLLVLARYMQILSDDMCRQLEGRAINIHHSFLPGFKGAKPYHQAHDRGVKLIGATAHYVTDDLDEGPIIEQNVARVNHAMSAADLVATGRDVERVTLAEALKLHLEHRVLMNGNKTVVFKR